MQSRVKAASVNRALSPFVKAAKPDSTGLITDAHFKKLKSALALADGSKMQAAALMKEIVRDSVRSLDLAGLELLQNLLGSQNASDTQWKKPLLEEVECSIKDAKVKEAQRNLSEALILFSKMSAKPFELDFLVSAIQHNLLTIVDLVQPTESIAAGSEAETTRKIGFEAASSVITLPALKTWFNGHSSVQQNRLKTNLWSVANDSRLSFSDAESDQAMFAFCRTITTLLWPKDSRHGIFYN